jgi:predicted nucleotidyltransferase component of viral defense system
MEHKMILHNDIERFSTLIRFTAEHFHILPAFIEKDYWITRSLKRLSQNQNMEKVVFKGGTSLAKAYRLTNRFSEDIDIAVIDADSFSGNQLKMLIKRLAKDMASNLEENVVPHTTSKGSRFYRALYKYPQIQGLSAVSINSGQILIEINTYANPYPYIKQEITCFITNYLTSINRLDLIEEYQMQPFTINVLDKRRTIVEKLISLFRFSFSEDISKALAGKIRHFYDLYYLVNDSECDEYIKSENFKNDLTELMQHDQQEFDEPQGWQTKTFTDSPLTKDFPVLWENLRSTYLNELQTLAFSVIPDEKLVAESFMNLIANLDKIKKD